MPRTSVSVSRRQFMVAGTASALSYSGLPYTAYSGSDRQPAYAEKTGHAAGGFPFQHGVASGDPLQDKVILWTRITPPSDELAIHYRWRIARDPEFHQVVNQGQGYTNAERDFTVKVDADRLAPGQSYYYVFEALGQRSDIGRTRTLPTGEVEHLRIAFISCSNYARGYFNVYKEIAQRADLDVVLHLGDYIYEYSNHEQSLVTGRVHQPLHVTRTLADYRQRHACYKTDRDLQEVHRQHPFIVIWDDHEVANNAWGSVAQGDGGADNHSTQDGDWRERLSGAVRAYMEWMPIREQVNANDPFQIYRRFRFGNLLDLNMLDTRLAGRDQQSDDPQVRDAESRTLLGYKQEQWLEDNLAQAQQDGVIWKLLGQQVMMSQFSINQSPLNHDQWDGYPAARQRLFNALKQAQVDNFVVLTGDIHSSWALALNDDPFAPYPGDNLGVELVTPAVSSPGIESEARAALAAASLESLLPHLDFVDFYYRGYVLLDIKPQRIQAEWWVVDEVERPRYASECLRARVIPAGQAQLLPAPELTPAKNAPAPAPTFSEEFAYLRQWRRGSHFDTPRNQQLAAR
ncbi:alkaline phosphatase D family protein [Bacterioplanoides sp.]|uniref:alkaline phosphatase D family protein n=1 Tax=Bacterioplanoides sp. TaxID=2066072 RepID=UPI003B009C84